MCVDGTTVKAANGMDTAACTELRRKKPEYVKEQPEAAEKYLNGMDENDKIERGSLNQPFALGIDPNSLPGT